MTWGAFWFAFVFFTCGWVLRGLRNDIAEVPPRPFDSNPPDDGE